VRWLLWALAAHTAVNARLLRTPSPGPVQERVSVLVPARDEEARIETCVRSLVDQGAVEVLVLDDGSTDRTAELARAAGATVLSGADLPDGWLGKPFACQQLADAADPDSRALVFVDADVVLSPGAVGGAVALMRELDLQLVSPYPRQEAPGATRLVQPLQQWSWLSFLPLRWAERSSRASLTAATGQLLVVDRAAYERAGGHAAVRDEVAEDLALLRAVKRSGGRGVVVDGTHLATCRMYDDWPALRAGYAKSLPELPALVPPALLGLYVLPLLGRHRRQAYAAMVVSRAVAARRTGTPVVDALAHPVSVVAAVGLWARARWGREEVSWKGRPTRRGS
jgi:cellulose synthase/poly-beta-1,6-N-acetylglucosamine synthase-like glycosyltransferase